MKPARSAAPTASKYSRQFCASTANRAWRCRPRPASAFANPRTRAPNCEKVTRLSRQPIAEPPHAPPDLRKADAPVLEDDSGLSRKIAGVALDDATEDHRC